MYAILEQPVRAPSEIDAAYPKRLEAVLRRALEKQPAARYQSAAELQNALATCLDEDLTAPGDRHIARALASVLDAQLEARHRALCAAAERVRRGESLEPPSSTPPHSSRSTTQEGVALTNDAAPRKAGNKAWLGVALVGVACVAVGWYLRPVPGASSASRPEGGVTVAATAVAPAPELAAQAGPLPAALPEAEAQAAQAAPTAATLAEVPARSQKARSVTTNARAQPTAEATSGAATVTPASKRGGPSKPPRVIDHSNPFND